MVYSKEGSSNEKEPLLNTQLRGEKSLVRSTNTYRIGENNYFYFNLGNYLFCI